MAYTTAQKIADLLGVDVSEIPAAYVTYADAMVENVLGRSFNEVTVTNELYDGSGTKELVLNNYPITTVTKLEWEDENRVWHELSGTAPDDEYVVYKDEGILKLKLLPGSDWFSLADKREATFECGTLNWRV